ncbi:MAG: DUF167 domain-containing protein [Prosthecobacter sp.]|uniref:DUF167 domain-containing protein n=1 Tax=Prosthecobacter sp. TaxID=1965333 RepID=UPI003904547D
MIDRAQLAVRVTPNAKKSAFAGWTADEKGRPVLLVKLQSPPVDGKANAELLRFLAEALDCAKGQITLLRGTSSRQKAVELPAAALERLPK